jgi:hypothetical protein
MAFEKIFCFETASNSVMHDWDFMSTGAKNVGRGFLLYRH